MRKIDVNTYIQKGEASYLSSLNVSNMPLLDHLIFLHDFGIYRTPFTESVYSGLW